MILYKTNVFAIPMDPKSKTEQEFKDSCDINKMLKGAMRGMTVRGSLKQARYGLDDMNMDLQTHLKNKAEAENDLADLAKEPVDEELLKHIPQHIKDKFQFKAKQKNDDKSKKRRKRPAIERSII